jgi:thioredoxin reductase
MGLIHNAINQGQQAVQAIAKSAPAKAPGVLQLLVVGAGPAGLGAALKAKELGLDYAVLEQEQFGGALRSYPRQKIVMTAPAHLPLYGKVKLTRTTKEALLDLWGEVRAKTGITVEEGVKVLDVKRGPGGVFAVSTSTGERRAQRVLLAVGRRGSPRKLGIPGEELPKVTYKLLDPEQYGGTRCLVVGGGDSAVEIALALARQPGTQVTLCHRGDKFDRVKPDNFEALEGARAAGQLAVRLRTVPKEIRAAEVVLPDGAMGNDFVFVCIGGELPTAWLSKIGIAVKTMWGEEHPAMGQT